MVTHDPDLPIRLAAFDALATLVRLHGPVLPWDEIAKGFQHGGSNVLFANRARGIFRPKAMTAGALSIKKTVPREGREARYDDQVASGAGHFEYDLQGKDINTWDNRWLHEAHRLKSPMIYFYGVAPGLYRPLWPVFVSGWDPANLRCFVSVDEGAEQAVESEEMVVLRRRYVTVEAKRRLHQDAFRALVMTAYKTRCAVCGLPRDELLDAAHILAYRDERGRPEVPNGLALCQLHHRAYDRNLVGIRPDYIVEVSASLLDTSDGPVLEHVLKDFQGSPLRLPRRRVDLPSPDYLDERYAAFRRAG